MNQLSDYPQRRLEHLKEELRPLILRDLSADYVLTRFIKSGGTHAEFEAAVTEVAKDCIKQLRRT